MISRMFYVVVIAVALSQILMAQRIDTIRTNPKAVQLREIWRVRGSGGGGDEVGEGSGSIGNGPNGLPAWAVYFVKIHQWRIYYGDTAQLSTTPARIIQDYAAVPPYPTVGHFWGGSEEDVGFPRYQYINTNNNSRYHLKYSIFRKDAQNVLADTPAVVVDPNKNAPEEIIMQLNDVLAADLDGDGADELILIIAGTQRGESISDTAEIWIYRGGPNFSTDAPTLIIRDNDRNGQGNNFWAKVADIDGDHRPDLICSATYYDLQRIKMFLSSDGSPWDWNSPDRTIRAPGRAIVPNPPFLSLHDVNGDGVADLAGTVRDSATGAIYLWMSGKGRNARTRPFDSTDYDVKLKTSVYSDDPIPVGPLNDSTGRYAMLPLATDGPLLYVLSGGADGPDGTIDAYGGDSNWPSFGSGGGPIGDVNGDGWPDVLGSNFSWYGQNAGIAVILAGGPYIPRDSVSLGVRDIDVADKSAGLSFWPNPIGEELHIAWRGDLTRMPERFEVHDITGEEVVAGTVRSSVGTAVLQCGALPAGRYLLTVFDRNGSIIATAPLVKLQ